MIKYANFTVKKRDGDLIITHGLLERRQLTVPLEKVQAVRVVESMDTPALSAGHSLFGNSLGLFGTAGKVRYHAISFDQAQHLGPLLNLIVEQYTIDPAIKPLPKKAMPRYIMRQWLFWIPVTGAFIFFFRPIGYLSIAFVFLGTAWGYLSYKAAGFGVEGKQLTLRFRRI